MSKVPETETNHEFKLEVAVPEWLDVKGRELFDRATRAYSRDKVMVAAQAIDELKLHIEQSDAGHDSASKFKEIEVGNPWLLGLSRDVADVSKLFNLLIDEEDTGSWQEVANSNSIRTYYRKEKDTEVHSIKVHAEILCPLVNICAVCNECDLIPTFMTMVPMEARNLRQLTNFSQLVYFKASLIWPFSDRDIVFEGRGVDMLELGCVPIVAHPATECLDEWAQRYPGTPYPSVPNSCTRMGLHFSGGIMRALGPRHTLLSAVFNVDPRLSVVPMTLINWVTRKFAHIGFEMLRQQMDRFEGSAIDRRVKEKKVFYEDIQSRIDDMWSSHTLVSSQKDMESKSPEGGSAELSSKGKDEESLQVNLTHSQSAAEDTYPSLSNTTKSDLELYVKKVPSMIRYSLGSNRSCSNRSSNEYSISLGLELFGDNTHDNPTALYYALKYVDPGILWAGKIQIETWGSFVGLSLRDVWCVVRKTSDNNQFNISSNPGILIFGGKQADRLIEEAQALVSKSKSELSSNIKPTSLSDPDTIARRANFAEMWNRFAQNVVRLNWAITLDMLRSSLPEISNSQSPSPLNVRCHPDVSEQILLTLPCSCNTIEIGIMEYYQKLVESVTGYAVPLKAFIKEKVSPTVEGWTMNLRMGSPAEALMWKWAFENLIE